MHFQAVHFAASQCILPTMNAHVRLLETKMAVGVKTMNKRIFPGHRETELGNKILFIS
jgi:hypothetical protein